MIVRALLCALLLTGCKREEEVVAPPPLPVAPAASNDMANTVAEPAARPSEEPPKQAPAKPREKEKAPGKASEPSPKASERPKGWGAAYVPPPLPEAPAPVATPKPAAAAPAPTPAPAPAPAKPKTRVTIPRTAHVHTEIPSGLQADLDADPRMQPWVEKVIAIADGCHAKTRGSTGTIEAELVMHEEARPTAEARAIPTSLGAVAACATMALMRGKMPLFTGREGTRYTVRIVFE